MKKFNTEITSRVNRSIVLAQIYRNPMISRAELATLTGLNRSAITHILNELLRRGLVEEAQKGKAGSRGGRCPIHLMIRFEAVNILAIEIGTTTITGLIVDLSGHEVACVESPFERASPLREALVAFIDSIQDRHPEQYAKVVVIGIGCPGVVDSTRGRIVRNMFHRWNDMEALEGLRERFNRSIFIENDANAAAMGELHRMDPENPLRSLMYLFIHGSTRSEPSPLAIGGAVVLDGRLWKGAHHCAGEVALTINPVFLDILSRVRAKRGIEDPEGMPRCLSDLLELAESGDPDGLWGVDELAQQIGRRLGEFGAFLDTEALLVAIHPPEGKETLLEKIREAFLEHHRSPASARIRFLHSQAGPRALLWGIVRLGLERIFVRESGRASILFGPDREFPASPLARLPRSFLP